MEGRRWMGRDEDVEEKGEDQGRNKIREGLLSVVLVPLISRSCT